MNLSRPHYLTVIAIMYGNSNIVVVETQGGTAQISSDVAPRRGGSTTAGTGGSPNDVPNRFAASQL